MEKPLEFVVEFTHIQIELTSVFKQDCDNSKGVALLEILRKNEEKLELKAGDIFTVKFLLDKGEFSPVVSSDYPQHFYDTLCEILSGMVVHPD
jgi:hypothetical protein